MFSDIYPTRQFDRCQWRNCKISPPARKSFGPILLEGPLSDNTLKILCLAYTVRGHQFSHSSQRQRTTAQNVL